LLLKTTKDKNHYHVAYIKPDGTGITSKDGHKSHQHEVLRTEEETVVQEVEKHTHGLEELVFVDPKEEKHPDEEELKINKELFKGAKEAESPSSKDAKKADRYYQGDQWIAGDKATLKAEKRACLTINEIKPKVDMLSGHQRKNRTDIQLVPVESGDALIADVFNIVIKNILEQNNYEYEETAVFEDGMITGRGNFVLSVDYSENIEGDIKISHHPWEEMFYGPHKRLDGKDAEYRVRTTWLSMARLKAEYPSKADKIQKEYDLFEDDKDHITYPDSQYKHAQEEEQGIAFEDSSATFVDIQKKSFRLVEVQRRVYEQVPVVFNVDDDFYFNATNMEKKDLEKVSSIEDLDTKKDVKSTIWKVVFASNVILENEKSFFNDSNYLPFYANKRGRYYWGKVKEAFDAQDEVNKRHSQTVDIVNKMANYGVGVADEAFVDPIKDRAEFIQNKNKAGYVQRFATGFQTQIHEFQGVKFPNEVVAQAELSSSKIREIMNINLELLGQSGRAESGVAILQKQRQGLLGNEYLFDNLSLTKRLLGRLLVKTIQKVYTPDRILRLVLNQNSKEPVQIGGEDLFPAIQIPPEVQQAVESGQIPIEEGQKIVKQLQLEAMEQRRQDLLDMLENEDATKLDVVVVENLSSPTNMISNFIMLREMAQAGVPLPGELIVELWPGFPQAMKDKLIEGIKAQQQAQAEAESQKNQTEIQKTLIANVSGTGTP